MTIKNYTFLSQNGTEFPISATADRRLYLMLGGMDYSNYKMKHWKQTTNTALNRVYTDTSFVLGGAYFELNNQSITLNPNAINFVHVNIDLSNVSSPVSLSVETKDNSNSIDINTTSSVLKKCIEIVTTSGTEILTVVEKSQDSDLVKQLKLAMNPVGTVLTTINSTNPSEYLGGIWERFAQGRTIVGVDEDDSVTLMNTANSTGGSVNPLTRHGHSIKRAGGSAQTAVGATINWADSTAVGVVSEAGDNTNHNNWQPFVTVYFWKRTA